MTKNDNEALFSLNDKIEAAMLNERRLFLSSQVDNESATEIIRKLWYLETLAPGKPILFVINSPGGSVSDGFAIWDQIQLITSPVTTLVTGLAASMGSILSLCGKKGRRFATPYSRFMIHQPRVGGMIQGQATDLEIQAREILKTHKLLVDLYVKETNKSPEEIERAIDRDTWLSAEEALKFGLINKIVTTSEDLK